MAEDIPDNIGGLWYDSLTDEERREAFVMLVNADNEDLHWAIWKWMKRNGKTD